MRHLLRVCVAVLCLAGCAADVSDADQGPLDVESTVEALPGCTYSRGAFSFAWSDLATFSAVTNPSGQMNNQSAVNYLQNHAVTMNLPTGNGGRLIAWDDPSLHPTYRSSFM